jgi:hypothetical protein
MHTPEKRPGPRTRVSALIAALLAVTGFTVGCSEEGGTGIEIQDATVEGAPGSGVFSPGRNGAFSSFATPTYSVSASTTPASDIHYGRTVFRTDYVTAGVGGLRGVGSGTIALEGVTGPVTLAVLYWHSVTTTTDPDLGATLSVNGTTVTGDHLGFSSDNCWGYANSQAWVADVTALVQATGNGAYALTDFGGYSESVQPTINPNGASLLVFFDDGDPANDRDMVVFQGNDSNMPNPYDADGWNVTLTGIDYSGGDAFLQLHVADGQQYGDDAIILNGQVLEPRGIIFGGFSVPGDNDGPFGNGRLWDIVTWNITSWLTPGENSLVMTTGIYEDCLALVAALVDLPAGAAPEQPPSDPPPPPSDGTEACSPGFWGQNGIRTDAWPAGYSPSDPVDHVFDSATGYLGSATLLEALEGYRESAARSSTLDGARELLLRAAVAAILNEAAFGAAYPAESVDALVAEVNAALETGTRQEILDLKDLLDWWNNNYQVADNGSLALDEEGNPVRIGSCPL